MKKHNLQLTLDNIPDNAEIIRVGELMVSYTVHNDSRRFSYPVFGSDCKGWTKAKITQVDLEMANEIIEELEEENKRLRN